MPFILPPSPHRRRGVVLAACLVVCCCLPAWSVPPVVTEAFVLTASDGMEWDRLGAAVDRDGDLAVATTVPVYGAVPMSGTAYVFRLEGATWVEEAKLVPHDPQPYDAFGIRAALDGDVIAVGASNKDGTFADEGAVYVFRHDGTGWHEEAKLVSPDAGYLENFGWGIDLEGDVLVVGSHRENDRGTWSGAVWVYRPENGTWTPTQKLLASNGTAGAAFGIGLSLEGDTMVVGATHVYTGGPGEAYVFRFDGTAWTEEGRLLAPDSLPNDFFGEDVAGAGTLAIVGAPGYNAPEPGQGAAYVFRRRGGLWAFEQKLLASDPHPNSYAGYGVAVSATRAFVGASGSPTGRAGRVSVYGWTPTGWVEEVELQASDGEPGNAFGYAVSRQGNTVLVGAPGATSGAYQAGAAYGFELVPPPGPADWLEDLVADLLALDLPRGVETSLVAKAQAALRLLRDGTDANDAGAAGALEALLHQLDALSPEPIPAEVADALRRFVLGILLLLEAG